MTLVVNLFGGPGCGKSTMAAGLFYHLKRLGYDAELVTEYAKELTFDNNRDALLDQIDIFSTQRKRVNRLIGKCDVVISDAPALICGIYCVELFPDSFRDLVAWDHVKHNSCNYVVSRCHAYSSHGRKQDENQARDLDDLMINLLDDYVIPFQLVDGTDEGLADTLRQITGKLGKPIK